MNGFPAYSVPFVASMHVPLAAAIAKPIAAIGTVGREMAVRATFRQNPINRRSRTRTAPNREETPRMWMRLMTPYAHTPDERTAWPSDDDCSHARRSYTMSDQDKR